ncbi:DUF7573 domain-containing protein [Halohasta litorea]|uniref:DUF7573 domain-containing protein n=1 Tax=Halohasta litorea TaxID=869891 RepID=A0ABD6D563_9EURY|nr:hypothetical protein [Halohasta litorea]MEA1932160.1 hypothetical protein [Euryarchaeota archaeon]
MSEERSLTEFSSTDAAESHADDSRADDGDNAESIEPATVTYRWRSEGAVCAQCGDSTEKQWLDDSAFVCPDCKSWA